MSSLTEELYPVANSAQSLNAVKDIFCGSVAGSIAKFAEYPFDTIKVRLQSQPNTAPPRYAGPLDCLRQSLAHDGIRGMYRGVSAPLFGAAAEMASIFCSYAIAQDIIKKTFYPNDTHLPLSALVTCGAISGAVTSLVLNPIELLKCKMQVQSTAGATLQGPGALIANIYRHHGILGFWYGQTGTLLREVGGTAAYFGAYESVSAGFRSWGKRGPDDALPVYQRMLAGASAGMSYNFLFYPADTIKSTMQTEVVPERIPGAGAAGGARVPQRSFRTVGTQIWHAHGVKGFYRGCGLTVCRSAPASALIFTIYETLRDVVA